jgi:hypothetical protein
VKKYVTFLLNAHLKGVQGKFPAITLNLANRLTPRSLFHAGKIPVNYTTDERSGQCRLACTGA